MKQSNNQFTDLQLYEKNELLKRELLLRLSEVELLRSTSKTMHEKLENKETELKSCTEEINYLRNEIANLKK